MKETQNFTGTIGLIDIREASRTRIVVEGASRNQILDQWAAFGHEEYDLLTEEDGDRVICCFYPIKVDRVAKDAIYFHSTGIPESKDYYQDLFKEFKKGASRMNVPGPTLVSCGGKLLMQCDNRIRDMAEVLQAGLQYFAEKLRQAYETAIEFAPALEMERVICSFCDTLEAKS